MREEHYRKLYNLIKLAFIDMQNLVNKSEDEHKYIFTHYNFPILRDRRDNGMPTLSEHYGIDGPKNYASLFSSKDDEHHYNYKKISSFQNVIEFFDNHVEELAEHPFFRDYKENDDLKFSYLTYQLLYLFDCYMHTADSTVFDEDAFKGVLLRFYNRIFLEDLPISICVPILLTRFEDDVITVTDNIRIRKLSDIELLSSYKVGEYSDIYELFVVSSATHILELQNYTIPNVPLFSWFALEHKEAYPLDIIDKWFAALRIVTHIESGYGQVLAFPDEWGIKKEKLIDVHGDKIFRYNYKYVTNKLWNDPTPLISSKELEPVNKLFKFFLSNTNNALNLAIRRLNRAYLREAEEDAIVDLVIGIEALVTNDEHGEITYKVSTRSAFILSTLPQYPYSIIETKVAIGKLYNFRSKVVHGASQIDKSRVIKIRDDISKSSVSFAIELLQYLILAIVNKPIFLNVQKIDEYFLNNYEELLNHES